jgi:hypothetical protein
MALLPFADLPAVDATVRINLLSPSAAARACWIFPFIYARFLDRLRPPQRLLWRRYWRTSGVRRDCSCADRKPVEGRQRLHGRLHVAEINLCLEKRDFVFEPAFVEVDVP